LLLSVNQVDPEMLSKVKPEQQKLGENTIRKKMLNEVALKQANCCTQMRLIHCPAKNTAKSKENILIILWLTCHKPRVRGLQNNPT
jgi:hypothetical protein